MCTCSSVWGTLSGWTAAKTLSLAVAGAVSSWRGKVDCSIASWTEWHCLHSLSSSSLSSSSSSSILPPPLLWTSAGSVNCTAQQCSPSAAADPAWALRICVGWDFLKGNAASRVSVRACVRACVHARARISSVFSPPLLPVLLLICTPIQTPLCRSREPSVHTHSPLSSFIHFLNNRCSFGVWVWGTACRCNVL